MVKEKRVVLFRFDDDGNLIYVRNKKGMETYELINSYRFTFQEYFNIELPNEHRYKTVVYEH